MVKEVVELVVVKVKVVAVDQEEPVVVLTLETKLQEMVELTVVVVEALDHLVWEV
jgi:hypothetical protein